MEPSRRIRGEEERKRKLEASNSEGSPVASDDMGLKALLDQHSEQMRRMQSQIDGLVAVNSTLQARLDCQAGSQAQEVNELREKCGVLESRCGSLERSIRVLRKDVSWSYTAPDIPRGHWNEQGRDDEYADNVEEKIGRIKDDVERIRNGENIVCECLDCFGQLTILHDDALLPHFRELADAIQLSNGIQRIAIGNIELRPSALRIMFPVLEGKVTNISMRRIIFPGPDVVECYEIIAASIRRNHALEILTWIGNQIPSDEQADLLIKSIIDNWSINTLTLDNCFNLSGVNGCRALAALMTCGRPFDWIHFGRNGLFGIDDVASALATNPQLKILFMTKNQLNDSDAELIAQALKQNTNLQMLCLGENNITSAGFEKIVEAIYDPSSLNAMVACNHTCWVDFVEQHDNYVGVNEEFLTPQQRRRRKLYELLSARHAEGRNTHHLDAELGEWAFTTKLVPKVLECIGRCSLDGAIESPTPLSLYFELMKSWKMPELYEHRDSK
ncbi:hypothetical protein THAOC_35008 [Thalassiosira oceanica]|uniref:Uncharacterized protein n=1 Tax=Thalassiosira oceanica TaxID=159749 RepID=K0RB76_THAOC|nr:hypothetical protein THAOC_35008 [Thalassiosira oceanica]|eukprot:EJK46326.1 hypothetical protein THAOC_35008 [Thalassiosira oceanica]